MTKVVFSIQYAGLTLQIGKTADGKDVTPLKPIFDLFGLRWNRQLEKVTNSAYLGEYLGVCTLPMWGADGQKREQTCILVSRVAAFLMSINPESVSAAGNIDGAKFLMEKQEEWADALHDYEEIGVAINMKHIKQQEQLRKTRMALVSVIGVKNKTADAADRKAVTAVIAQMTAELGLPYQPDLLG